jgi:hypothetical protein
MAEADPLIIAPGNGLERGRNGGSGIRAAIALPALMGRLNATSGVVLGAGNSFPKTMAKLQRPDLLPPGTRTLNIMDIGRHLADEDIAPPLRALPATTPFASSSCLSSSTPRRLSCKGYSTVNEASCQNMRLLPPPHV